MFTADLVVKGLMIVSVISAIIAIYSAIQCFIDNRKIRQLIERRRLYVC